MEKDRPIDLDLGGVPGEHDPDLDVEPIEITYDEHFYPARPPRLRPSVRRKYRAPSDHPGGATDATNPEHVRWLRYKSMLRDANLLSRQLSGKGSMWQNPFADPDARTAVQRAQVWFTGYPLSFVTRPGESYLAAIGDEDLWRAFDEIGIDAVHTGPVKLAGGLDGWTATPSVDGHFDRISMEIDPAFGTEDDFRTLCETAASFDGVVIDDIVPGHTGKGADFRLAEMGVDDYPGIFHMVEIEEQDWHLLPDVADGTDSTNLDVATEKALSDAGYIIGQLQRVIFYEPGVKETNWSVTGEVLGEDGTIRRWVYLHYFKAGQPSINWIDPSFAGMRLVIGDACHSIADLGSGGLRLDANGFLGVEKSSEGLPAWSEGHPLSEAANHFIASMVRKMGGFTFQELNLAIDDIQATGESGADLSYDFVNRPAYHHALVTGNTEFLRLTLNLSLTLGVDPASLVHALQNHDELTHELVHFSTRHASEHFVYEGEEITGHDLGERVRAELTDGLSGPDHPYNLPFTTNGIACTTASAISAVLGIQDNAVISAEQAGQIRDVHLLLAMFNALQPGVFAVSGWDLVGMQTLPKNKVSALIREGDTRWINRGAHDLLGRSPEATKSESGLPVGVSVHGNVADQLKDPGSFLSGLKQIIEVRRRYDLATAEQIDVPTVSHKAMLVMVHRLDDDRMQITALNFSDEPLTGTVRSKHLTPGCLVTNMFTDEEVGTVDDLFSFMLSLEPYQGVSLLVENCGPAEE